MRFRHLKNTGIQEDIWQKIIDVFIKYPSIEDLILFGSRAMGNFKSSSDIDLCLMGKELNWSELAMMEADLDDLMLPWQFDLIMYTSIVNDELKAHIKKHGLHLSLKKSQLKSS